MKAYSLTPPWSVLVAIAAKRIETRSRPMHYRGPMAIHSTAGLRGLEGTGYDANESGLAAICNTEPFRSTFRRFFGSAFAPADLPRGAIVGITEVLDCIPMTPAWIATIGEPERSFGFYAPGRFGIILGPVEWLPEPIPAKGSLGLWDWDEAGYAERMKVF